MFIQLHFSMRSLAQFDVSWYLKEKRSRKTARRKLREWRAFHGSNWDRAAIDASYGDTSEVLRLVAGSQAPSSDRATRKGRIVFVAPEQFSLLENPVGCLEALQRLAADLRMPKIRSVHIDLGNVKSYDVGANALLDVLVDEVYFKAKRSKRKVRWTGRYPANGKLKRLVKALGVIKKLEVVHEYPEAHVAAKLEAFDDRCRNYLRAVRPSETDKKSRVTQRFADHLTGCLKRVGKEFAPGARHLLCRYVSEVLDNAEQHAGMIDWTIQGYLDTHRAPWMCEIVIFNFGRTIAETFQALPPVSYTSSMVSPYLEAHRKKGFFQIGWNPEDLYTLIALQQYVSTKNHKVTDTRGNGTFDLIRFFEQMCLECREGSSDVKPIMTLISGRTRVLFDGTYPMRLNAAGVGVIAFNEDNDLLQRPDPAFVMPISSATFPGTVLSIKFPLSSDQSSIRALGVAK